MVSAIFSYNSVIRDTKHRLENVAKEPVVQRETKYFLENGPKITNVDEFLKNTRIFNYAMKAFGLEEMTYAKGMIRKLLTDEDFAKKLTDPRYAAFKETFDFKGFGEATMLTDKAKKGTVEKYKRMVLEQDIGEQNQGARLALYFDRRINELQDEKKLTKTSWAYLLLGDKALIEVVRNALSLSDSIGHSDIDAQKKLIEKKMSMEDLTDPSKRKKFIQRFLALYDMKNEQQFSPALNLLQSSTANFMRLSGNTTRGLISLKLGG